MCFNRIKRFGVLLGGASLLLLLAALFWPWVLVGALLTSVGLLDSFNCFNLSFFALAKCCWTLGCCRLLLCRPNLLLHFRCFAFGSLTGRRRCLLRARLTCGMCLRWCLLCRITWTQRSCGWAVLWCLWGQVVHSLTTVESHCFFVNWPQWFSRRAHRQSFLGIKSTERKLATNPAWSRHHCLSRAWARAQSRFCRGTQGWVAKLSWEMSKHHEVQQSLT